MAMNITPSRPDLIQKKKNKIATKKKKELSDLSLLLFSQED